VFVIVAVIKAAVDVDAFTSTLAVAAFFVVTVSVDEDVTAVLMQLPVLILLPELGTSATSSGNSLLSE
jgi:hypothetical protein